MFPPFIDAMNKSTNVSAFISNQKMIDCSLRFAKSQSDVMKSLCDDLCQEIGSMAKSSDSASMAKNLPGLMSTVIQTNTEASALMMKNAQEFQNEILQLTGFPAIGLPGEPVKNFSRTKKTA